MDREKLLPEQDQMISEIICALLEFNEQGVIEIFVESANEDFLLDEILDRCSSQEILQRLIEYESDDDLVSLSTEDIIKVIVKNIGYDELVAIAKTYSHRNKKTSIFTVD